MITIASLLDSETDKSVRIIWDNLKINCELLGIQATPYPHFSWQSAENYDRTRMERELAKISKNFQPFWIRTSGLGVFTEGDMVIYLTIVSSDGLRTLHRKIWKALENCAIKQNIHYSPELWVPHVTVAHGDVVFEKVGCAIRSLAADSNLYRQVLVEDITVLFKNDTQTGIERKFILGKG